jgi:hypothetical protein
MNIPDMRNLIPVLFLFAIVSNGFSQTRLIAHKSHSGTILKFRYLEFGKSGFGGRPPFEGQILEIYPPFLDSLFQAELGKSLLRHFQEHSDQKSFYRHMTIGLEDSLRSELLLLKDRRRNTDEEIKFLLLDGLLTNNIDFHSVREQFVKRAKDLGLGHHLPSSNRWEQFPAWVSIIGATGIGLFLYRKSKVNIV